MLHLNSVWGFFGEPPHFERPQHAFLSGGMKHVALSASLVFFPLQEAVKEAIAEERQAGERKLEDIVLKVQNDLTEFMKEQRNVSTWAVWCI